MLGVGDLNLIGEKSKQFAIRIIKVYQYLCADKKEYILSKQLLRAGTSIGANIAEAEAGFSRKDFLAKLYVAFKETAETMYWLDLLYQTGYLTNRQYISLYQDAKELKRILSAITKTTRENT